MEFFPPARLYIEDVERIHRILQEDDNRPVSITSGAYEFDEPSQFRNLGDRVRNLNMMCRQPGHVSVGLSKGQLRIWADEDSGGVLQKVRDIKEVINTRRRPLMAIFSRGFVLASAAGIGVGLGIAGYGVVSDNPSELAAITGLAIAILGFAISVLSEVGIIGSVIYTVSADDRPGWWKRNRDALLVGIIVAVIAFVLGYFVGG
jgi:hypothetical protein